MARIGRCSRFVAFAALLAGSSAARLGAADDPAAAVATTLAVQDALRRGRELLQNGHAKAAVEVLEEQLTRVNGNATYLAVLREAYYGYVKELQLAQQDELAAVYLKRLQILDRGARIGARPPPTAAATETVARGVRCSKRRVGTSRAGGRCCPTRRRRSLSGGIRTPMSCSLAPTGPRPRRRTTARNGPTASCTPCSPGSRRPNPPAGRYRPGS
jgi:hypothetical protein